MNNPQKQHGASASELQKLPQTIVPDDDDCLNLTLRRTHTSECFPGTKGPSRKLPAVNGTEQVEEVGVDEIADRPPIAPPTSEFNLPAASIFRPGLDRALGFIQQRECDPYCQTLALHTARVIVSTLDVYLRAHPLPSGIPEDTFVAAADHSLLNWAYYMLAPRSSEREAG